MRAISIFAGLLMLIAGTAYADNFTLVSPDIGGQLTQKEVADVFGCSGDNTSPTLSWSGAPKGTKSFAVTMYDPDAPSGSGWWHWLIFDVPANVTTLPSDAGDPSEALAPKGSIQSTTDFGKPGFGGACPPPGHGAHRYIFTVYALGVEKLGLGADSNPALVGFNLNAKALAKASIIAYFGR